MDKLVHEIILRAVEDWKSLCNLGVPTRDCNFTELENFFRDGCRGYIAQDLAERIYKKLQAERRKAEKGTVVLFKRNKLWIAAKGKVVLIHNRDGTKMLDALEKRCLKSQIDGLLL